jgi:hypothetical protein
MKLRHILTRTALVLTLICAASSLLAQEQATPPILIHEHVDFKSVAWSPDSSRVIFAVGAYAQTPFAESPGVWYSYDVNNGTYTTSPIWPLMPALTPEEIELLQPVEYEEQLPFIYEHPTSGLLVYPRRAGADPNDTEPRIAVSDRQTVLSVGTIAVDNFSPERSFQIFWSENGDSFAYLYEGALVPSPIFGYEVTSYDEEAILTRNVSGSFPLQIRERTFLPQSTDHETIYEISADGTQVLFASVEPIEPPPEELVIPLIIWEPANPENSVVLDDIDAMIISAASFAPDDESHLLILSTAGLVYHDLASGECTVLRDDITSDSVIEPLFSPDGRWLLVQNGNQLYLVDVEAALSAQENGTSGQNCDLGRQ